MLLAPSWLPLLPLANTSSCHTAASLPVACSIDALRDSLAPFGHPQQNDAESIAVLKQSLHLPELAIVPASSKDVASLVQLHALTLPLPFDSTFLLPLVLSSSCLVLVAKQGELVTGCITAHLDHVRRQVQILSLCVHPGARRKGLAMSLLRALSAKLPSSLRLAVLHVQLTNAGAIQLYQRAGFIITALKRGHYRGIKYGGKDAYEMAKPL